MEQNETLLSLSVIFLISIGRVGFDYVSNVKKAQNITNSLQKLLQALLSALRQ
jgi:hypothetical protein